MPLIEKLQQFGLDQKKARVYVAALELGMARAKDIAAKTKLERSTTYDILGKLAAEDLVSFFNKRGVKYFVAEKPEKIKQHLVEKQLAFDEVAAELKSIENKNQIKPRIKYYEGITGIKTVLEDTLTTANQTLMGILSVVDLFEVPGKKIMEKIVQQRIDNGIHLRVIRSRPKEVKEYWPTEKKALRELRYAPADMVFAMTMYMYNNKVSIISSQKENFGMVIESNEYCTSMRNLFEALWQMSKSDKR